MNARRLSIRPFLFWRSTHRSADHLSQRRCRPWKTFSALLLSAVFWLPLARAGTVYLESFENSDGGYTTGLNSSWAWGIPLNGPGFAHSGTNVWATNPNGDYLANEESYLTSPTIPLQAYTNHLLVLTWWQYLVTEADYDFASLEISTDGGSTWSPAYGEVSGAVNTNWTRQLVRLAPECAVDTFRLRFHLQSDNSLNYPGFYVDDIQVAAITVRTNPSSALTIYRENFETNSGGYAVAGVTSWQWGVPASGPGAAHSGSNVWATCLDGFYGPDENGSLLMPPLDLSAYPNHGFVLSWWQFLVTEAGNDLASVELSRNGGSSWQTVYGPVSGPVSEGWCNPSVRLDSIWAVSNLLVRFRFTSDESLEDYGFYLDDVELAVSRDPLPVLHDLQMGMNANAVAIFSPSFFSDGFYSPETNALEAIRIVSLPSHGQIQLAGRSLRIDDEVLMSDLPSLTYAPDRDFVGWDAWTWGGRDFLFYAATNAQLRIYVTAAPIAGPDAVQGLKNTEVCLAVPDLLRNDSDLDGGVLRVPDISPQSQQGGTVKLFGAIAYYTPAPNFIGSDSFTYYLIDGQGGSATGWVAVTVMAAPVQKTAAPVLNTINGYFYQTNRITNPLTNQICGTMSGVRLYFSNLPTGARLINPSGTGTNGLPYLISTNPLAPGQTVDLVVIYSVTNRVAPANVFLTTQVLSHGAASGTNSTIRINQVSKRPDGNFFIEFTTDVGRSYQLQCSSNLRDWTAVTGVLVAPSRHVQWIDDYPPPMVGITGAGTNRFYRVLLLSNP